MDSSESSDYSSVSETFSEDHSTSDVLHPHYFEYVGVELLEIFNREKANGYRPQLKVTKAPIQTRIKAIIWTAMEDEKSSILAKLWVLFIGLVILFSVIIFIVQSWPSYQSSSSDYNTTWFLIETFIVAIFTLEYCARILSAPHPFQWMKKFLSVIDLLCILPYFISLIYYVAVGYKSSSFTWFVILRVLRVFRVLRLFKIARFNSNARAVGRAGRRCYMAIFFLLFTLFLAMFVYSTLLYYAEQTQEEFDEDKKKWFYTDKSSDPGKESPFQSIPHTLWWSIVTMTTVGYGDTFPITPLGKMTAGFTMICGIFIVAFPVGLLATKFGDALIEEFESRETEEYIAQHTTFIVEQKLICLEKLLTDFNNELDIINDICNDISTNQAELVKLVNSYLYKYDH